MTAHANKAGHVVSTSEAKRGETFRYAIPVSADMHGRERLIPVVAACGVERGTVI